MVAFEGVEIGLDEIQLVGSGEHHVRVSWRYVPKAAAHEYDRELWSETIIIRIGHVGRSRVVRSRGASRRLGGSAG